MKLTFKQFLAEEHNIRELQQRKKDLSDQEREQITKAGADAQDARGNIIPAIWKSVNQAGADVYVANLSGRRYKPSPTLDGAINIFLADKLRAGL